MDLTYGINPHQDVAGMVHDYEKREAKADADAIAAATAEPEFNLEAERLVQRGRLNPETGAEIPLSSKARRIAGWVPSEAFLRGFDNIRWDR
jgi:hypothetical protein